MTNTQTPALPTKAHLDSADGQGVPGMSLRDWFAGQVVATFAREAADSALISSNQEADWATKRAYYFADAMLSAREEVV